MGPPQTTGAHDRARISTLLDEVLDLLPEQRAQWLRELQLRDPLMGEQLASLLAMQPQADASGFLQLSNPAPMIWASPAGHRIGAYTLVRVLGEGGMGSVWLGERSDGQFEGQVAIKLLHPGLLRAADVERFRREGSLLARLSHPNIARLIDAGVTEHQQPYLVLEYVRGRNIDEACDAAGFDLTARIRLFIQVLEAVAHAHAQLVVHRDIKPSNVLVGSDGWVKLLDFGVAKLADPEQSGAHDLTRETGRAFTPQFAAPEQLAGEPVTTATDVYALGVLLYILLAGRNPLTADATDGKNTAALRLASDTAAQVGRVRAARELPGDLDNILAKALRSDPLERYASADAFAEDLRRYLRCDTVSARPDSFVYRTSRYVKRHKGAVAGALVTLLAILGFSGVAIWQAREAALQRSLAQQQTDMAIARGAAAYAVSQAPLRLDRALLLGAEGVLRHSAPETSVGLLTALDAARSLVGFRSDLGSELQAIAFRADRREAVTIDLSGRARRWSLPDWKLLAERQTGARYALGIYYRAQQRVLLVVGETGGELLDAVTLQPAAGMRRIASPDTSLTAVFDLSEDGGTAVAVAQYGDRVLISDAKSGAIRKSFLPRECSRMNGVTLVPQRQELALACDNGVQFYDLMNARHTRAWSGPPVSAVEFSADGRYAAFAAFDNQPVVVETRTLRPVMPTLALPGGRLYASRFSGNGRQLALGTDSGWVAIWDLDYQREIARFGGLEQGILAVEWLGDDFSYRPDTAVVGRARLFVLTADSATEWDLAQTASLGRPLRSVDVPAVPYPEEPIDAVRGVAYRKAAAAVEVIALADGSLKRSLPVAADDLASLTVSPDGTKLFVSALTKATTARPPTLQLMVVATANGEVLHQLQLPPGVQFAELDAAPSLSARFSGDGQRLAVVAQGQAAIWSLASGQVLATAAVHPLTKVIAWSPDDRVLVTTREYGLLTFYDSPSLRQRATLEHLGQYTIKQMFPSAAAGGIVVTSEGGEVYVLDAAQAKIIGEPYRAGGSQLQRSAVSPDGRTIAAWSSDGAVRIWDAKSRLAIGPPLRGHPAGRMFNRIWFNNDGTLATYTPGLKIDWNLDLRQAAQLACQRAGRNLTEKEWQQFVGDLAYAPNCKRH